ncbi:hypothetical protein SDC9_81078 [bioreactor metagenome]|uniref:Uncharacterized protein n=1 Tax=bioreactor metagenome TaxID=1076179 RepID=A0A644Z0S9_9ZZZZ
MVPSFDNDMKAALAKALDHAPGFPVDAQKIRLPARAAHASYRPPQDVSPDAACPSHYGSLYGVPWVDRVRLVNGWMLFDFSPVFFSALVERINQTLPLPSSDEGSHGINRMLALARHSGSGCPDIPAFHRTLILAVAAVNSRAAYRRADLAVESLFHSIPPKERCLLLPSCGSLGGALARLLCASQSLRHS